MPNPISDNYFDQNDKIYSSTERTYIQELGAGIQKFGSKLAASAVGMAKSHLLRTIVVLSAAGVSFTYLAGLATGITIGIGAGIYLAPWVLMAAVGVATLGLLYLTLGSMTKLQKNYLELSVPLRKYKLWNGTAWNKLYTHTNGADLYISQMFNRWGDEVERFLEERESNRPLVIISIQQPWERLPQGLSLPYTQDHLDHLEGPEVELVTVDSEDFLPVGRADLNTCKAEIKKALDAGKDVVIHCKAGKGRSAMGAAAYLREHVRGDKFGTIENVVSHIMELRPESSIYKPRKVEALKNHFGE